MEWSITKSLHSFARVPVYEVIDCKMDYFEVQNDDLNIA